LDKVPKNTFPKWSFDGDEYCGRIRKKNHQRNPWVIPQSLKPTIDLHCFNPLKLGNLMIPDKSNKIPINANIQKKGNPMVETRVYEGLIKVNQWLNKKTL